LFAIYSISSSAEAAKNKKAEGCKVDCSFASKAQLISAEITDGEGFKVEYGAVPTSRYDICACKDGSIAIYAHGQCGRINSLWEITDARWK
jgi:hypothetical protein